MSIAETNDLKQLIIEGTANDERLMLAWEQIVEKNAEANSSMIYSNYVSSYKSFNKLMSEYTLLKACITALALKAEPDLIKFIRDKGHKINTETDQQYEASLMALNSKADSFLTRIKMKANELDNKSETTEKQSFDSIMASISLQLGFTVNDDITLSRYNEYKKLVKARKPRK
jgi:hypothetical protein